jgi:hypothetical protein
MVFSSLGVVQTFTYSDPLISVKTYSSRLESRQYEMDHGDKIETDPKDKIEINPGDKIEPLTTVKDFPPQLEVPQHYKDRATALLQVSTFAATITFTIILRPRDDGQATPGLVQLAYANALFCGAIIGSVFVIIGIEVANAQAAMRELALNTWEERHASPTIGTSEMMSKVARENEEGASRLMGYRASLNFQILLWAVKVVAGFVGLSLYAAFYVMIYATHLFLQYDGPFIFGTVIYAVLGFLAISIWITSSISDAGVFSDIQSM